MPKVKILVKNLPETNPKTNTKPAWKKPVIDYPKDATVIEIPYKWQPEEKKKEQKAKGKPKPITLQPKRKKRLPDSDGGKHPWTREELDLLVSLFNEGVSYKEICLQIQTHNESTIKDKVSQLRRKGLIKGTRMDAGWSQEQDEILIRMKREGATLREIAPVVGKSKASCSYRFRQLVEVKRRSMNDGEAAD